MREDPFFTSAGWIHIRYQVLKKHNGCCQCCGTRGSPGNPIQVDHIKPRIKYPELELKITNLQVLCRLCNIGKSFRDQTDWRHKPSAAISKLGSMMSSAEPASRAKLEQLSWLIFNGGDTQIKTEARLQYKRLSREIEQAWIAKGSPT